MVILAKTFVNVAILTQIGLLSPPDTWKTPHEPYGDMLCFLSMRFFLVGALGHNRLPPDGILSCHETPEQLIRKCRQNLHDLHKLSL